MTTRKLPIATLIAVAALFAWMPASATVLFSAVLSGSQEVPPNASTASGQATGMLTGGPGAYVFSYEIEYSGLTAPINTAGGTGGHLHLGQMGTNGPVVHVLDTSPFNYTGTTEGTISGQWAWDDPSNPLTDALASDLRQARIYINIHTDAYPSGELRGQWVPAPATLALLALPVGLMAWRRSKADC